MRTRRILIVAVVGCLLGGVAWYLTPYPRGMLMAYIDHTFGHYVVQAYGEPPPPWYSDYGRLLQARYDVTLHEVADCVATHSLMRYTDGYNSVSKGLLQAHYGHDIFEQCWDLAQKGQ
jgi:hypothetical protein